MAALYWSREDWCLARWEFVVTVIDTGIWMIDSVV